MSKNVSLVLILLTLIPLIKGLSSSATRQIRLKMVVLPAFAFPTIKIRNRLGRRILRIVLSVDVGDVGNVGDVGLSMVLLIITSWLCA
jgi:hypothetical protein